jgi:hypothetical protein
LLAWLELEGLGGGVVMVKTNRDGQC